MKHPFLFSSLLCAVLLLAACVSPQPNAEFVKTVNFSALDTFNYKHTLVTGMDFRESEEILLENLSEEVITSELLARGFERVESNFDFFAVVKWKKAVSTYADPFDHIDGYGSASSRRDDPTYRFNSRIHLTIEIYEASTGNLFWRNDLPNIFDSIQLAEERIVQSLKRGLKNFPQHIEKDPNLPNIE